MSKPIAWGVLLGSLFWVTTTSGQDYDIFDFYPTDEGPWSEIDLTTLVVPQVLDGSVTIDGSPSSGEYGGFSGVTVTPGINAWILDYPADRSWDGPDDSSFTYYLAHDTRFLYIGVSVKDDVVISDDDNLAFWRDDAIEFIVDANNDDYDINTDASMDPYGGHSYVNFEGRFSEWDDSSNYIAGTRWSTGLDWTYGSTETDDILGVGGATADGWQMEVRMSKRLFEDPDSGRQLVAGATLGFNIGIDDDDRRGTGPDGNGERSQDLEVQYWWANRARPMGWDPAQAENYSPEEIASGAYLEDFELVIDSTGRLTHGGAGEIMLGGLSTLPGDFNGNGTLDADDINELTTCSATQCSAPYDLNNDSVVNQLDVNIWVRDLSNSWIGDANLDGQFNSNDLVAVLASGTYETDLNSVWTTGDFNGDGRTNSADLVASLADGGYEAGPRANVAAVPEPSSSASLLLGAALLFAGRLRPFTAWRHGVKQSQPEPLR